MSTESVELDELESNGERSESFIEAELELKSTKYASDGFAKLIDAEVIEPENLPEDYVEKYSSLSYDKYILFDAKITEEKEAKVVLIPDENSNIHSGVLEWTGTNSIGSLANRTIPIEEISEDVYVPCALVKRFGGNNVEDVKEMVNRGYIEYDVSEGKWGKSSKYKDYEHFERSITTASSIMLSIAVLGLISFLMGNVTVVAFFAAIVTYYTTKFCLNQIRNRSIKPIDLFASLYD